jgi:peptidyl-prolyl cis-trans isomerase D
MRANESSPFLLELKMGLFEWIRDHKRLMLGALIVLIFPSFVFWGYDQFMGDGTHVAEVHGRPIPRERFESAHREQLDQMRRVASMTGQAVDTATLDNPVLRQEVLDRLIQDALLQGQAIDRRIHVGDMRLREEIGSIPNLRQADGSFNLEQYKTLLAAQGKSEFQFEQSLRQELALRTLPDALGSSGFLPTPVLQSIVAAQLEKREIRQRLLTAKQFRDQVKPTPEQLEAFFKKESKRFEQSAYADVELLVLSAKDLVAGETADPEAVKTFYEQNPNRFGEPEQRRASHILFELSASANEAAKAQAIDQAKSVLVSIKEGKDFAALAKQLSKDSGSAAQGGDLGFFSRDAMVKPFADAVFAMKPGAISEPVVSEFGVHVIKLTDIRPAKLKPFEQVRGDIEQQMKQEKAQKRFAELAESFSNIVYEQSDSLQPAAKKINRQTQSFKGLRPDGRFQSNQAKAMEKADIDPRVLRAVFSEESIRSKRNTDAIEIAPGVLVSARLNQYQPPSSPPLDAVRDIVVEAWVVQAAMERAKLEGEKLIEALNKQLSSFDTSQLKSAELFKNQAIQGLMQSFSEPMLIGRGQPAGLDQASLVAAFKLGTQAKQRVGGLTVSDQGYRVIVLGAIIPAPEDQLKSSVPMIRDQLASLEGRLLSEQYLKYLRAQADVKTFPNRIANTTAKP